MILPRPIAAGVYLHSIMYLLIPGLHFVYHIRSAFTFHNVSINSSINDTE